jgi:hypothetical protein
VPSTHLGPSLTPDARRQTVSRLMSRSVQTLEAHLMRVRLVDTAVDSRLQGGAVRAVTSKTKRSTAQWLETPGKGGKFCSLSWILHVTKRSHSPRLDSSSDVAHRCPQPHENLPKDVVCPGPESRACHGHLTFAASMRPRTDACSHCSHQATPDPAPSSSSWCHGRPPHLRGPVRSQFS